MTKLIDQMAIGVGMREADVRKIIQSAPIRYKHYRIPKRSGGTRLVSQPAREVKALQRILLDILLYNLPVHPAATAYRPNISLLANALPHAKNGPILKLDFKNFFPSLDVRDWQSYCREKNLNLSGDEVELTSRLLFFRSPGLSGLTLAIGAPSSPHLSNVLMFDFDSKLTNELLSERVTYTRYADDLTFSAPRTGYLTGVEKLVRSSLRNLKSPKLFLNDEKRVEATTKYKRVVTGLVLTNDGRVSIGKRQKRNLHASVHKASLGQLPLTELQKLCGWLGYVGSVEPSFLDTLTAKYGRDTIQKIRQVVVHRKVSTDGDVG
jgi:RNA-directed DNA polymerase